MRVVPCLKATRTVETERRSELCLRIAVVYWENVSILMWPSTKQPPRENKGASAAPLEVSSMTVAVSIIIPARDEAAYLPRLLASLERQHGVSMDVTLADAGSRDDTREIARRWGCAITEGGLPGVGRNAGARLARSNQFVFLDADVELPDAFLEKNIREFQERRLAIGTTAYVPISNKRIDHDVTHKPNPGGRYAFPLEVLTCVGRWR
jgi:cellulose synthase/poly-beta-1,6-N-acetylglucosamine synthase-like glycosyltransferase